MKSWKAGQQVRIGPWSSGWGNDPRSYSAQTVTTLSDGVADPWPGGNGAFEGRGRDGKKFHFFGFSVTEVLA